MNISRSALLPYSARQMYDVVADISAYPAFLKWCIDTEILNDSSSAAGNETKHEVVAKIIIAYKKMHMNFTTRNLNDVGRSTKIDLVEGPLSTLQGEWIFQELEEKACKVSIDMQFDFEKSLTNKIMEKIFSSIVTAQFDAFIARAKKLYGDN